MSLNDGDHQFVDVQLRGSKREGLFESQVHTVPVAREAVDGREFFCVMASTIHIVEK